MGFFSGIADNWQKAQAACIVQNLLELHVDRLPAVPVIDPASEANRLVGLAWDSTPDIFRSNHGQRPHKVAVAVTALSKPLFDDMVSLESKILYSKCLATVFEEFSGRGAFWRISSIDRVLIEKAQERFDNANLFINTAQTNIKFNDLAECSVPRKEGEKKFLICNAISKIAKIDPQTELYSASAASALITFVFDKASIGCHSPEELYIGALFVHIAASYMSPAMQESFEMASTTGALKFLFRNGMLIQEASLIVGDLPHTYNTMVKSTGADNSYLMIVGQAIVDWCHIPSEQNTEKLVKVCRIVCERLAPFVTIPVRD